MAIGNIIPVGTAAANCYLVLGDSPYLVDTTVPKTRAKILQSMAERGLKPQDLKYILITHHHYDHVGNAAELKRLSGAEVAAGEMDAMVIGGKQPPPGPGKISFSGKLMGMLPSSWLEKYQKFETCEVGIELHDGDRLDELGLEVLALPGHTEGGIALYNRGERWAFVGDMVSNILGRTGPPFLSFSYDRSEILNSIERLAELDLDYAFPGHGSVLGPDAGAKISELAAKLRRKW